MDKIKYFLKSNKKQKENVFFPVSEQFKDEQGNLIEWEIKALSTDEVEKIREDSTDKNGFYNHKKFVQKILCASVVDPNLNLIELQDSYGVKSAEELITKILDCPADYYKFVEKVFKINKLDEAFADKIAEAKN